MELRERIASRASVDHGTGCWNWRGGISDSGYGVISVHNRSVGAHRASFEAHIGAIPSGLYVCHRCDNRACVNPAHLFLGTAKDNTLDMHTKLRANPQRGEQHHAATLTEDVVRSIRGFLASGGRQAEAARRFNVNARQVGRIARRERWRHVN